MPDTMRAIRLTGPVDIDGLTVSDVPIPEVRPGWVRIRVMAFGVNESEVTSRKGESDPDFSFPRILGIEAVGVVDAVGDGVDLEPGQKVATMMGGLGRSIDGSYAEYTLVDAANVIPFDSDLPWEIVGALPEMLQTAHGSLTTGLQLQTGQTRPHPRRHLHRRTDRDRDRPPARRHGHRDHPEPGEIRPPHSRSAPTTPSLDDDTLAGHCPRARARPDSMPRSSSSAPPPSPTTLSLVRPRRHRLLRRRPHRRTGPSQTSHRSASPPASGSPATPAKPRDLPADALDRYLRAIEADSLEVVIADVYPDSTKSRKRTRSRVGHRPGKHVVVLGNQ